MKLGALSLTSLLALIAVGCSDDESGAGATSPGGDAGVGGDAAAGTVPASFTVRPGVEIATVFGSEPGTPLTLCDTDGNRLITIVSDEYGQAHFSLIPAEHGTYSPGDIADAPVSGGHVLFPGTYVIKNESADPVEATEPFEVLDVDDVPDPSLYDGQTLTGVHFGIAGLGAGETETDGFNYVEVRDGVKLSVMVRFPDPALYGDGPYPTVIEYSGYSPSRPNGVEPGSRIATLLGYATVGVNMRGTGCSGGVFDVFNPAQHADGYDVVEVVARQPWVKGGKVGMVGLSYSGIAQLYVASTNPPSLAAITPLSVIADSWQQAWPGGIFNQGFTREWLAERDRQASAAGQSWTQALIDGGDTACEEHQRLRAQNINFEVFLGNMEFRPDSADGRSLPKLVGDIDVPVYMTGAWQDEQTGPQFANMLDRFESAPVTTFNLFNGRHPDGYSPLVLTRWFEFLELYVNQRVPEFHQAVEIVAPGEFSKEFGVEGLEFEPLRFDSFLASADHAGALAAYDAEPHVRVLFESGADPSLAPGAPKNRFEQSFDSWPPPSAQARSFYLDASGALSSAAPSAEGVDVYLHDADAGDMDLLDGDYDLMGPIWQFDWTQFAEGDVLSYLTEPFAEDTVIAGPGYAELFFSTEVDDANVQVTLTEVRPDGIEYLVTSGWLRAGHHVTDDALTDDMRIGYTFAEEDYTPLTPGEFTTVKVPIPSVAAAFRAGSQLRVMISTPGRNHARWLFANPTYDGAVPSNSVARGGARASRIVMPTVTGITVPAGYAPCPSLRGQACRTYDARANTTQ